MTEKAEKTAAEATPENARSEPDRKPLMYAKPRTGFRHHSHTDTGEIPEEKDTRYTLSVKFSGTHEAKRGTERRETAAGARHPYTSVRIRTHPYTSVHIRTCPFAMTSSGHKNRRNDGARSKGPPMLLPGMKEEDQRFIRRCFSP